ncbi:MAG: lipid A phosphoethanolamine transferase [Mediterranea sp.]|jgi:glucan phosphoethanolaminetransferase (alkaline phosphatase superfamily)|nr:lipid A phosphoethanolamine transferase [Mediterranea sp.]
MKLFNYIKHRLNSQEYQFYIYLLVLIIPNIVLNVTEPLSCMAKLCNLLLPLACYSIIMSLSDNLGKMFWILFPILFLGAFQLVLIYLFGHSIIAVDMFLNLATTNSGEAFELLDNLLPAIVIVLIIYVPSLIMATLSILQKKRLPARFVRQNRKRAGFILLLGVLSLGITAGIDTEYTLQKELFPINVLSNVEIAIKRSALTERYHETSAHYTFGARATHPSEQREVYIMVIGETSRADNWSLYGYERDTNPLLSKEANVTVFTHALSQSNTTHKSVPMLLSEVDAHNYDSIYYRKSIITAFKEAGFHTAFFSNQRYNHSFIDFFGQEADTCLFIKETGNEQKNIFDEALLPLVAEQLKNGCRKQLIVLHTYGSHFNYRERYPASSAYFTPDYPAEAKPKYRNNLMNAYDNTIRYTDELLDKLIRLLRQEEVNAALLYTSDHGEDIFDDRRKLFLHASPIPSYYQIHVPFLLWMSDSYIQSYPEVRRAALQNKEKDVSSSSSFFHTLIQLGGIAVPSRNDSLSVVSPLYTERPPVYLDDHDQALPLNKTGMAEEDFVHLRLPVSY